MNTEIKKTKKQIEDGKTKKNLEKITEILRANNVQISDDKKGENVAPFNMSYYSTVLRLSKLPKNASLILARIHFELISLRGIFHDSEENRGILKDGTGYSSSMINKGMQSLKKPLKILNNQPAIIKIIQKTSTNRILKDRYIINPYLYNSGDYNENRTKQIFVTLSFIENEQDFDISSVKQVDSETQEVLMDTDDFNFDIYKAFEKLKEKDPVRWQGVELPEAPNNLDFLEDSENEE
jgi:hypothetical protein